MGNHLRFRVVVGLRPSRSRSQWHLTKRRLSAGHVATRLPAQGLDRARRFYSETLGLEPLEERPGGLRYVCDDGVFRFSSRPAARPERTRT